MVVVLLMFEAGWAARWGLPSAMVGLGGSHRRATSTNSLQGDGDGDGDGLVEGGEGQGRSMDYRKEGGERESQRVVGKRKGQ